MENLAVLLRGEGCDNELEMASPEDVSDKTALLTESIVQALERQLVLSKAAGVQRDEEAAAARLYGAGQALKLKKTRADLDATLRDFAKETRFRQKAEEANQRLMVRVAQLEEQLKVADDLKEAEPTGDDAYWFIIGSC